MLDNWAKSICPVLIISLMICISGSVMAQEPTSIPALKKSKPRLSVLPPSPDELAAKMPVDVAAWLKAWEKCELSGRNITKDQLLSLEVLIDNNKLPSQLQAALIQLIAKLDGNVAANPLYEKFVLRAESDVKNLKQGDTLLKEVIDPLWVMHSVLWDSGEFALDERLITILKPWEIYGSGHSQWVSYCYAESLYMQGKYAEAYAAFASLVEERKHAFELSEGLNQPVDWMMAVCLYMQNGDAQPEDVIKHLEAVADRGKSMRTKDAEIMLVSWYAGIGNIDKAKSQFEKVRNRYNIETTKLWSMATCIEKAETKNSR